MDKFLKLLIFVLSCSIIVFGAWFMTKQPRVDPTLESLLKIKSIQQNTKDVLNETGVESVDDINFKLVDDNIEFKYGKHKFIMKQSQVSEEEFIGYFKKLKLKVVKTEDGNYIIRYDGKMIKQIV